MAEKNKPDNVVNVEHQVGGVVEVLNASTKTIPKGTLIYARHDPVNNTYTIVDEPDILERDIEMVMTQANVTRERAIDALKRTGGDLVNSIMDLTM